MEKFDRHKLKTAYAIKPSEYSCDTKISCDSSILIFSHPFRFWWKLWITKINQYSLVSSVFTGKSF